MKDSLTPLAQFFYSIRAIRLYYDGDGLGFVWNWWHPASWICVPLFFAISVILDGAPATWKDRSGLGCGVAPYFKKHPEKLKMETKGLAAPAPPPLTP